MSISEYQDAIETWFRWLELRVAGGEGECFEEMWKYQVDTITHSHFYSPAVVRYRPYPSRSPVDGNSWIISCIIRTSCSRSKKMCDLYPTRSPLDRKSWIISFIIRTSSASSTNGPYPFRSFLDRNSWIICFIIRTSSACATTHVLRVFIVPLTSDSFQAGPPQC